jgi:hypothetical protein
MVDDEKISKFHALKQPNIGVLEYIERIGKYANCSDECFVLALIYIDRVIRDNPKFQVNSLNIHRLLITSIMLAAKFFDDQYYNNVFYGKVGGIPRKEINSLEVEFLFMVNFNLYVTTEHYRQYEKELATHKNDGNCLCTSPVPRPIEGVPDTPSSSFPRPEGTAPSLFGEPSQPPNRIARTKNLVAPPPTTTFGVRPPVHVSGLSAALVEQRVDAFGFSTAPPPPPPSNQTLDFGEAFGHYYSGQQQHTNHNSLIVADDDDIPSYDQIPPPPSASMQSDVDPMESPAPRPPIVRDVLPIQRGSMFAHQPSRFGQTAVPTQQFPLRDTIQPPSSSMQFPLRDAVAPPVSAQSLVQSLRTLDIRPTEPVVQPPVTYGIQTPFDPVLAFPPYQHRVAVPAANFYMAQS